MKTQIVSLLSVFAAVVGPTKPAYADGSVWDSMKSKGYRVDGKITSIAFNEQNKEMLVKVASASEPGEVQTLKVCSYKNADDIQSVDQTETMAKLRQAFANGDRVQLSYNSRFDRCLSQIARQ